MRSILYQKHFTCPLLKQNFTKSHITVNNYKIQVKYKSPLSVFIDLYNKLSGNYDDKHRLVLNNFFFFPILMLENQKLNQTRKENVYESSKNNVNFYYFNFFSLLLITLHKTENSYEQRYRRYLRHKRL